MQKCLFLGVIVALLAINLSASADTIFVRGRDKPLVGEIKSEDATTVVFGTIIAKKKVDEKIPSLDVLDIHYDDVLPIGLRLTGGAYNMAKKADKEAENTTDPIKLKSSLATAIFKYGETLKEMKPHKSASRTIEYKIAILMVRQAGADPAAQAKALQKLLEFKRPGNMSSWQINHVMPTIAQLQVDANDFKGAQETYEEMAGMAGLPLKVKNDAELMVVQIMVKGKKIAEATKRLEALAVKGKDNPEFVARVKMMKAEILIIADPVKNLPEATALLQQVVKENNDKEVKARAHNTLGECLFKADRYNDSLWEFLWVDTVFNQDKNQQSKAKYYLWKVFERLNNPERAEECRQSLLNDAPFRGTEWHAKAVRETK